MQTCEQTKFSWHLHNAAIHKLLQIKLKLNQLNYSIVTVDFDYMLNEAEILFKENECIPWSAFEIEVSVTPIKKLINSKLAKILIG